VISAIVSDLRRERENYIDGHPIFSRLRSGEIQPIHYFAYLRETYHLIRHTPEYLTIAAGRMADDDRRLAEYFRAFAREETGHELLCVRDLEALGQDVEAILSGHPSPGCWGMVTQCYYWAAQGNPVALLGDAFATEELGAASGLEVARLLETDYGIPRRATNFLRVHGREDEYHFEAAARAIEWYADDPRQYAEIVYATKMTYRSYGQLFTDVLTAGDAPSVGGLLTRLTLVLLILGWF
jgi:pyrroloquinoline quinone (PQQ) biosynthesis protein C